MGLFFGTDGLRGVVNEELTFDIAYKCGNALAQSFPTTPTILIGSDTRTTASYITLGFAGGATSAGANVIDLGIIPTAGVSYLVRELKADFGVVISASHNSAEYNGIKIFDHRGYKLQDKQEENIERKFIQNKVNKFPEIGLYKQDFNQTKLYADFLTKSIDNRLDSLTIVLDGSNGASFKIAPTVFRTLGAKIIATNCRNEGLKINDGCGSLHPKSLAKRVLKHKADLGLAFDGDSDRVLAVDENGNIVDGDMILYILALHYKNENKLPGNAIVGTSHTNMGIQLELKNNGVDLIRSDIGDKYVLEKMLEKNIMIGGEQSGHIILKNLSTTGDGILAGLQLASILAKTKKPLSELTCNCLFPQININVPASDKLRVINSEALASAISKSKNILGQHSRVLVRASGTEPKVRVMVESRDIKMAQRAADDIVKIIKSINDEQ